MSEIQNVDYKNAAERDILKQQFSNPKEIDQRRKTIVFSTPSETGTSYFRLFEPMRVMYKHFADEVNVIYTECLQPKHYWATI